ncbi:PTS glucitol/sorbitol transporter subunit IIA [Marinilactibacillus psychrotolerans]|uniref:PTS glucitol/sorbitol transporter subunit IIA n=1 Tax=Marinilactibacillus psychrotolerans TaxID=191770 RepID=A0ABW8UMT7_9LACT
MKSKVIEIGEAAFFEGEPVVILFGKDAPEDLKEVCVIHEFEEEPPKELLKVGSKLRFGDQEYSIEKIGDVANETLQDLGHISLYFDFEDDQEILPGAAFLSPGNVPAIQEGTTIEFLT